jgi:LCP family protein required for cell wall assembly
VTKRSAVPQGRASSRRRVPAQGTQNGRVPAQSGHGAPPGGRAAARRSRRRGKKRPLRIVALVIGFVVLVGGLGAVYVWNKLDGNIKSSDLFAGSSGDAGKEKADAFGRTPINILMIGSDARSSKQDCKLGGSCHDSPGERADVEMIVHISADRSNATVMSVPRDLETGLPACTDEQNHTSVGARTDMINSALNWGPGCSVAAIHQLTGIPIDHFMMVDFGGVVSMSDAVGGVHVCVSDNVYDPDSHLKLKAGSHTLKGVAALEFLRTRHGFGDGSDLSRTYSQHIFISSLISKLKSAGTLTDPTAIWGLANAATKALTVDNTLDSISKLIGLAGDVNKVPTNRITFTTMQTVLDTAPGMSGRALIGPGARTLFSTIANDQSLTTSSGHKSSAATAAPSVPASQIAVEVDNGTDISGRAGQIATALINQGFSQNTSSGNGVNTPTTELQYPSGKKAEAKTVASALGLPGSALKQGTGSGLVLTIGADWPSGDSFPGGKAAPAPADTQAALGGAHAQTGDNNGGCAQVSHAYTLPGMTPIQAYSRFPNVKDSAP